MPQADRAPEQMAVTRRTALGGLAAIAGLASPLVTHAAGAVGTSTPAGWQELASKLAAVSSLHAFAAAELDGGIPKSIYAVHPDLVLPVGSSFKFYVLGAVAEQVGQGRYSWEQLIPIRDSQKSVPGGDLRYVPDGATYTLRYLAERMMQKSDNTATDVLIDLAGREAVERQMAAMGHHQPSLNIPLFKTREFAFMKLVVPRSELDRYFALDVPARRAYLANVIPTLSYDDLIAAAARQTAPIDIMRMEWLATRGDLINAVAYLWRQSRQTGLRAVAEIIALETQLALDGEVWPYVGFKGGSEMGVLSGTWLMQRNDGRLFAMSAGFADPEKGLDMDKIVAALEAAVGALEIYH